MTECKIKEKLEYYLKLKNKRSELAICDGCFNKSIEFLLKEIYKKEEAKGK